MLLFGGLNSVLLFIIVFFVIKCHYQVITKANIYKINLLIVFMEQYYLPKELGLENLRFCIDNYSPESLYIRFKNSLGGKIRVSEKLEGKKLDFIKNESGLDILINSDKVFHFSLGNQVDFFLEYERILHTEEGSQKIILDQGVNLDPYGPNLPEPNRSFLRTLLDNNMMEITFPGRVNLKFHSLKEPKGKYWVIDKHN